MNIFEAALSSLGFSPNDTDIIPMAEASSKRDLQSRLRAIQDISAELIAARDPQTLIQVILDKAMTLLNCDAGSFVLYIETLKT